VSRPRTGTGDVVAPLLRHLIAIAIISYVGSSPHHIALPLLEFACAVDMIPDRLMPPLHYVFVFITH
jgi:hypothetical protein